jgi:hypothetical protein
LIGAKASSDAGVMVTDGVNSAPANSGTTSLSSGSLAIRFGIQPFSILDARKGCWQDPGASD